MYGKPKGYQADMWKYITNVYINNCGRQKMLIIISSGPLTEQELHREIFGLSEHISYRAQCCLPTIKCKDMNRVVQPSNCLSAPPLQWCSALLISLLSPTMKLMLWPPSIINTNKLAPQCNRLSLPWLAKVSKNIGLEVPVERAETGLALRVYWTEF